MKVPENAVNPVVTNTVVSDAAPVRAKGRRRLSRVGMLAAAVAALMAIISVTAGAMGFNLWGWMPMWNNEQLSFEAEETEQPKADHIPTVLIELGINEPLYPTWLPKDLMKTQSILSPKPLFLHEAYQGNERDLTITISPTSDNSNAIYQKEGVTPLEYVVGNTIHYIFDNTTEVIAVWNTEHHTTVIAGNISTDEAKAIIDSVYEVHK